VEDTQEERKEVPGDSVHGNGNGHIDEAVCSEEHYSHPSLVRVRHVEKKEYLSRLHLLES
jgi:hypothetical protein